MKVIEARNVNDALTQGLAYLHVYGISEDSRNGTVLVAPGPVTTVYNRPWERVLLCPQRDANPFFHLMEAIWMLAGRRDVAFIQQFNSNIARYSDDGVNFHGAYGYRWRHWFGYDQLAAVAEELRRDPTSRRCVLSMWDAGEYSYPGMSEIADNPSHWANNSYSFAGASDLHTAINGGKDVPCNTHIYFDVRGGALNMTVCCRSNDIWWGAYGANAVHFSVLQELIAVWVGVPMGTYRQISNNYHLYTAVIPDLKNMIRAAAVAEQAAGYMYDNDWENRGGDGWVVQPTLSAPVLPSTGPTVDGPAVARQFLKECEDFCIAPLEDKTYQHDFFNSTLRPMYQAYTLRKQHEFTGSSGLSSTQQIQAPDWRYACVEWIKRREQKKETK